MGPHTCAYSEIKAQEIRGSFHRYFKFDALGLGDHQTLLTVSMYVLLLTEIRSS